MGDDLLFDHPMATAGRSHDWISDETTRLKEDDFRDLVGRIHVPACVGIHRRLGRAGDPPYTYMDLHAGPGRLRDNSGATFDGSPLIAVKALASSGISWESWHFERDPAVAAELRGNIDRATYPAATIRQMPFDYGVEFWLAEVRPSAYRYGLVYADPWSNTDGWPIPVGTFNAIAQHSPRVDLLAYIAANSHYKRSGLIRRGRRLADDIAAVNKRHVLIREEKGAEQFTFILFSDYPFGEWRRAGFHRLDSKAGADILTRLNFTRDELREIGEATLW